MNNTIKELFDRKSVRVFTDKEISDSDRRTILEAAMQAPTAGNMQIYTIIDIQSKDLKEKMAVLCDNQAFIAKAKMVLVFCADYRKWYDAFLAAGANPRNPELGDLALAISDTNIAAQNSVVAAHSLGIGSCYIGDVMENCEKMRECLNLPKYVFPAAMLVFGYPTQQQIERTKPLRCKLEDIVCVDSYELKDETRLREMFSKECTNKSFEDWAKAFCERKYNSDFSREMSRSVAMYFEDYMQ